ncbi:iron complex transport system substrate-binding protein [Methylobacterium sp. UNC300MFChir4.1]|uniref:ABC transporter substrate-binding protein n=1 Tax=Methylobacterium sp. UNC300MFChir4.1 TaxID=1502747 RepID=UPI0008B7020C|nr:ABC transporter substrate-binding protein [Methylobacterium sp. UNC300MFChir4.1]SEP30722.1 iron complex transport system substrate-binding protein [Methylobacterium sp. UNC300MFChir4.1]
MAKPEADALMSRSASTSLRRADPICLAVVLFLTSGGAVRAEPTRYPLTLENCGATTTVKAAPRRVVSVGQTQTEILYALGLADRVVGTAVWFGPVAKPYEAMNAGVKRLADNSPSFEAVLGEAPDLVTATFAWHIGPHGAVARREQFGDLGVPVYVSPADCVGKDNSAPGDGVRTRPFAMELVYRNIRELGQLLDVSSRAEALVTDLMAREDAAVASMAGRPARDLPVVVWFSSRDVKGDAFVAGAKGVPAYLLDKLGARNVITTDEEWPLVGWESIAAADPAVIVLVRMDRRLFPADDVAAKLDFLRTDPVASRLTAVREKRIIVMDVAATRPGLGTIDGIGALADDLKALGLAR